MIGAGRMANNVHYPSPALHDVEIAPSATRRGPPNATADAYGVQRRHTDYRAMVEEVAPQGLRHRQPHLMYDVWPWCLRRASPCTSRSRWASPGTRPGCWPTWPRSRASSPRSATSAHQPACWRCQEVLARGLHGVCEFYKHGPSPMLGPRDHMMDDCVHAIDTLRWICAGARGSHSGRTWWGSRAVAGVSAPLDVNWITATLHFANGATGIVLNSWCSGRRVFRVQMHGLGVACDADVEGSATLYSGDTRVAFDARQVAGSDQTYVFGAFRPRTGSSSTPQDRAEDLLPFRDCLKTMEVAEKILARALLEGA